MRYGFRIGFNTSQPLHPNVVQEYLDHEGRVIGPLAITDHPEVAQKAPTQQVAPHS